VYAKKLLQRLPMMYFGFRWLYRPKRILNRLNSLPHFTELLLYLLNLMVLLVVIGISDQFKIPVKYIGVGEGIESAGFNKLEFVDSFF
jgi:hypothetical protein